jgi:hypothetical protein
MADTKQTGLIRLNADLSPAKTEDKARIANLAWYTGATVKRQSWDGPYNLTLSMKPEHVQMERLQSGKAPLLDSHSDWSLKDLIGIIEKASLDGSARVRFSNRPEVDPIWQDVQDGIIRNASVGAAIHKLKETTKEGDAMKSYLAVDWEPLEVSLVPIGADPNAGLNFDGQDQLQQLRAKAQKGNSGMETNQTGVNAGVVSQDVEQIRQIGMACHLPADFVQGAIATGITLENARNLFIDEAARRSDAQGGPISSVRSELVRDSGDTMRLAMEETLFARMSGKRPSEIGREYAGARISDMARDLLISRGVRVSTRNSAEIVKIALSHSTSDFPNLLQGTGQRVLGQAYQAAQPAIKTVARQSSVQDFRAKSILRLGEAPALVLVPESGELHQGTRAEFAESYRAYTYGRLFGLTRQAIVNDDLGAFSDFISAFGQSAAGLEAQVLVDLLTSNAGLGPTLTDTKVLFHTDHGNISGSGAAPDATSLAAARLALRTTTGLDGATIIEVAPRYLLLPAALESDGEKILAQLYPAETSNVNPFSGKLQLLVEPRLDAADKHRWYIFGDPAVFPVLEYAYLEGYTGPRIESREGWETLGVEFRCYEDFGAGAIGYRGSYTNAGH